MSVYETDVCIVGSGVSGALVATRLAPLGVRVLILETGREQDRARALERMNRGSGNVYDQRKPPARSTGSDPFRDGLAYLVGGSTWHWVGTAFRLLPQDLQTKSSYGVGVDWPFGYDDLAPFYDRAEVELGVAGDTSSEEGRTKGYPLPAFPRSVVDQVVARAAVKKGLTVRATPQARTSVVYRGVAQCCSSSTCAPLCPVGSKYDATRHLAVATHDGAQILAEATATRVVVGADGQVTKILFKRPDRTEHEVRARHYVLACNAFQIPRLLLLSRTDALPTGVANSSDQVGRNLMDHAITVVTGLAPIPSYPGRGPRQTGHIADYTVTEERRRKSGFNIEISNKQSYPIRRARELIRDGVFGKELHDRVRLEAQHLVRVKALLEVLPDPDNRVILDESNRDPFGDPGTEHVFDVGDYCRDGAKWARGILEDLLKALHCIEIHGGGWNGRGLHISGTARMGTNRRTSVVDAKLRCHDHANLWIAGSATFPTVGMFNPTLTVAAVAIRLGDELARTLRPDAPEVGRGASSPTPPAHAEP